LLRREGGPGGGSRQSRDHPINVNQTTRGVAVDTVSGAVYVGAGIDTVIMIDPHTQELATIAAGQSPALQAVDSGAYTVFVAHRGEDTVGMIDTRSGAATALRVGRPRGIAADPITHTAVASADTAVQVMFLRVATLDGSSAPRLSVATGSGDSVELTVDPQGAFRSPEDNEYVGDMSLNTLGDNVFDIMDGLVSVDPALAWRLGIRNTYTGDSFFTWVVAYYQADTNHPWVEPPVDYQVSATIRVGAVPYLLTLDPARASAHTNDDRSLVVIDPSCRRVVAKVPILRCRSIWQSTPAPTSSTSPTRKQARS
jgi:hypothetical protein